MQISLSPELERFVNDQLKSGRYTSASDLVSDALNSFRRPEQWSAEELAELRREIQVGISELDRGEAEPWDVEEIKQEGRRLLAARQRKGR